MLWALTAAWKACGSHGAWARLQRSPPLSMLVQAACAKVGCRVHIQVLFVRVYELQYVCVGVYIPV